MVLVSVGLRTPLIRVAQGQVAALKSLTSRFLCIHETESVFLKFLDRSLSLRLSQRWIGEFSELRVKVFFLHNFDDKRDFAHTCKCFGQSLLDVSCHFSFMSMSLTLNQNARFNNLLILSKVVKHIHCDNGVVHPGRVLMSHVDRSYLGEYFSPLLVRVHVPFLKVAC